MADHDHGYKRLFSHPEMVADLLRDFVHEDWVRDVDFSTLEMVPGSYEWLWEPEMAELRRSFAAYLLEVLLPDRVPGITIPQVVDLQEVKSMLAERVTDWTRQWKQEGLEEGRKEGLQEGLQEGLRKGLQKGQMDALATARGALLRGLERRFGPLPEEIRRRVDAIASIEELTEFSIRAGAAPSLTALAGH